MTVKELIDALCAFPDNMRVMLSRDDEMNGVHECCEPAEYVLIDDEPCMESDFEEEEVFGKERVVVL